MFRGLLRSRRRPTCIDRTLLAPSRRPPFRRGIRDERLAPFTFEAPADVAATPNRQEVTSFNEAYSRLPESDKGLDFAASFSDKRLQGLENYESYIWERLLSATIDNGALRPSFLIPWMTRKTLRRSLPEGLTMPHVLAILFAVDITVQKYESASGAETEIRRILGAQGLPSKVLVEIADRYIRTSSRGQRAKSFLYTMSFEDGNGVLDAGYRLATLREFDLEPHKLEPPRLYHHRDYITAILGELLARRHPLAFQGYADVAEIEFHQVPKSEEPARRTLRDLARKRLEQAMNLGLPKAWATMGRYHEEGSLALKDTTAAVAHYRRAVELGHVESNYKLGKAYELGWIKADPSSSLTPGELALQHFEAVANVHGDSAYEAALRYYDPLQYGLRNLFVSHTPKELLQRSEDLFGVSAELHCRPACVRIAEGLLRGEFGWKMTSIDRLQKARQWFFHAQLLDPRWESPVLSLAEDSPLKKMDDMIDVAVRHLGSVPNPGPNALISNRRAGPRGWLETPKILPAASRAELRSDVNSLNLSERLDALRGSHQVQEPNDPMRRDGTLDTVSSTPSHNASDNDAFKSDSHEVDDGRYLSDTTHTSLKMARG